MVLVLFFITIFVLIITLFSSLEFKIDIKNLKYSKTENKKDKINDDYEVIVYAYMFRKIKIYNYKLKNLKFYKKYSNNINSKIDYSILKDFITTNSNKTNIQIIEIEKFNLDLQIGTENVILTSGLVTFSSILISLLLSKFMINCSKEKLQYNVKPIYENVNKIELFFESTIRIRLFSLLKAINSYLTANKKGFKRNKKLRYNFILQKT